MARDLDGDYAYAIQGFMQMGTFDTGKPEALLELKAGLAIPGEFRKATERMPQLVISGYCPYAESGHMRFNQRESSVQAVFWTTIRGFSSFHLVDEPGSPARDLRKLSVPFDPAGPVHGQFLFAERDPFGGPIGAGISPSGIITLAFDLTPAPPPALVPPGKRVKELQHKFVWDYAFIMVSDDEILLQTAGRFPRPVTATGVMKRIQPTASGALRRIGKREAVQKLKQTERR